MKHDLLRRRVQAWLDSGLVDPEFYGALRGRAFTTTEDAALDLVEIGMPERLSPNPLLDFASLPQDIRRAWRKQKAQVVVDHLAAGTGAAGTVGPLADARDPQRARAVMIDVARTLSRGQEEPVVDWAAVSGAAAQRIADRVSVIIPTHADSWYTIRAVAAVLDTTPGRDVEVVVVDNGCPAHSALALAAAFLAEDRVRVVHLPRNLQFAGGCNRGFSVSTGATVVFLNNDTRVRDGWLPPLLSPLSDPGVAGTQPLLLFEDDTIQTAGTVFVPGHALPCHLLVGHPPADGRRVTGRRFTAVTAAALAMRAVDVAALHGFDPVYRNGFEDVDLCLRALAIRPDGFRVVPESLVTHYESKSPGRFDAVDANRAEFVRRWAERAPTEDQDVLHEIGFVAGAVTVDGAAIPAPRLSVAARCRDGFRRWAINLPSTPGSWGDTWGDTYFGEHLAEALRALDQDVVVRRHGAHETGPTHLDDVALAIRGRLPARPVPGHLNILWVISHPEGVTADELDGFDLVFAASEHWSREKTREWGRHVQPLLQATAIDPAQLSGVPRGDLREALFVGNTDNGRRRDIVHRAVAQGLHVAVYGRGWDGLLPNGAWRGAHVPNHELPVLYRRHGVVLADHWPDMARHGFVANRVFDALAAGATVITDDVAGIEDVLRTERLRVLRSESDQIRGVGAVVDDSSSDVAAAHSFSARARSLLAAVHPMAPDRAPA